MSELIMDQRDLMRDIDQRKRPYIPVGDEVDVFAAACGAPVKERCQGAKGRVHRAQMVCNIAWAHKRCAARVAA